ncbi:MAG: 3'-5' exonuclease [Desulfuromonadaceae bacterium]|nr:3'-5' exonuclease [Desulfuromonadaceae bacterium]
MLALRNVEPTDEQLKLVSRNRQGVEVIKGAAGSGKTTTALLRLRTLVTMAMSRKKRIGLPGPVRVLVLTYNRTLRGYIAELAKEQLEVFSDVHIEIETFGKWAYHYLRPSSIVNKTDFRSQILGRGDSIKLPAEFLLNEVEYLMGRFLPEELSSYAIVRRDGRGTSPRVEKITREQILNDIILPYTAWKVKNNTVDWNDLAVKMALEKVVVPYDIIIVDESQDFSANQIRAIRNHLVADHCLTFIIDTAQRIYARGFTWSECGVTVANNVRLSINYRNTIEIAQFAQPLLVGLDVGDDGSIPDFSTCRDHGQLPRLVKGKFSKQAKYVSEFILKSVDLGSESVAILHPLGGGYFSYIKDIFDRNGLPYVDISRQEDWPEGEENIAFSTMHSAKGLEFDYVFVVGLNEEMTPHGEDKDDDLLVTLRKLLAMSIGRARKNVAICYKPEDASVLTSYFVPSTYKEVIL